MQAIRLSPQFADAYNNLGSALLAQGSVPAAMDMYRAALSLKPGMVDALCNLGSLLHSTGQLQQAREYYLQAIQTRPTCALAWLNLAGVTKSSGDSGTALQYFRETVRVAPDFADGWASLANCLKETGNPSEAKVAYERAIQLKEVFPVALGNLASCHFDEGNMQAAIELYTRALQQQRVFPDVWNNLGNAYRETGQIDASIQCYREALAQKPTHPHAHNNLGNSLKDKGAVREAIQCYVTACNLMPNFAAAHSNLASVLKEQGEVQMAIAHYRQALAIDPNFADAWSNLGNACKDTGRLQDAIVCYSTAVKLRPTFADAWSNLAAAYKDAGRTVESIVAYDQALRLRPDFPDAFANVVHSRLLVCDWRNRTADFARLHAYLDVQINSVLPGGAYPNAFAPHANLPEETKSMLRVPPELPHTLASIPALPSVQPFHSLVYPMSLRGMKRLAQCYAHRVERNILLLSQKPSFAPPVRNSMERLRVGYVSSDFGNHPLAHLMQSVFGMHDRSKYEVFCYAISADDGSQWRRKVSSEVEHFRDLSAVPSPAAAAQMIAQDRIHVLVNLNGYTKGARNEIFALRPAPVQVSYMGFCGTTGAPHVDYFVVDRSVVPSVLREEYTEALVFLPHCYFVNDHAQSARDVLDPGRKPTRTQYGIPEDKVIFANFNQLYKIDPRTFAVWCRILRQVPNSALWLLRFPPAGEANIRAAARAFGLPEEAIVFTDVAPKDEHLRRGALVDLFLDTPVCNAHTTGCDILWAGTPMLTVPGEKMASRVAASLLNSVGLQSCIVDSLEQYEQRAVELGNSASQLAALRTHLESARHSWPLFDTARWVRNCEQGYDTMWATWEASKPPADIHVVDSDAGGYLAPVATVVRGISTSADKLDAATAQQLHSSQEVLQAEEIVSKYMTAHPPTSMPTLESVVVAYNPATAQQALTPAAGTHAAQAHAQLLQQAAAIGAGAGAPPAQAAQLQAHAVAQARQIAMANAAAAHAQYAAAAAAAGIQQPSAVAGMQQQAAQMQAAQHGYMPAQAGAMFQAQHELALRQHFGMTLPPGVAAAGMPGMQQQAGMAAAGSLAQQQNVLSLSAALQGGAGGHPAPAVLQQQISTATHGGSRGWQAELGQAPSAFSLAHATGQGQSRPALGQGGQQGHWAQRSVG